MILLAHPTGNTFVRALLQALQQEHLLSRFITTLGVAQGEDLRRVPNGLRKELLRRSYAVPPHLLERYWLREAVRLAAGRLGWRRLVRHEKGWASVDGVYSGLDQAVAGWLRGHARQQGVRGVYAYEDGAWHSFRAARDLGISCFYELPIAYWETGHRLLEEEAQRWPEWEPTLQGTRDSAEKRQRKTEELALADRIVCPSLFVQRTLPEAMQSRSAVVEFGSGAIAPLPRDRDTERARPLRLLFAGSMSQRKGLADLLAAMQLVKRPDVVLHVMGSPQLPMAFYKRHFQGFIHEPTRPHGEVLELMRRCDVLLLPSIVEGRALVQQEALSCGLPLLVTRNAGGEDLVDTGKTGFLVPIRSPEAIAERIHWFADHRQELPAMREAAQAKAAQLTWEAYGKRVVHLLKTELSRQ